MSDSLGPHGLQHASFPVPQYLPEFAPNHVHRVSDGIETFVCPQTQDPECLLSPWVSVVSLRA